MRPDPATMSDCHLLDEYLTVYRDGGRRHAEIRAQLESRLAACDAARAEVAEARRLDGVRLSQIASLQEIIRNDTTPAGVEVARFRAEVERLRARVAVLEWGLAQLVLEGEDAAFDPLQDRLQRCGIMPTQAALDAAKETN